MKFLLVDDERIARKGLRKMLAEHYGREAEFREAGDVEAAREILGQWAPDIALLDVRMPGETGFAVTEELQAANPLVRVIVVSGYDDFQYSKTAIQHKVYDYILKPVKKEELLAVTRAALQEQEHARRRHQDTVCREIERMGEDDAERLLARFPWMRGERLACVLVCLRDREILEPLYASLWKLLGERPGGGPFVLTRCGADGLLYLAKEAASVGAEYFKNRLSARELACFIVEAEVPAERFLREYRFLRGETRYRLLAGWQGAVHRPLHRDGPLLAGEEHGRLRQTVRRLCTGEEAAAKDWARFLRERGARTFEEWDALASMLLLAFQLEAGRMGAAGEMQGEYAALLEGAGTSEELYGGLEELLARAARRIRERSLPDGRAAVEEARRYLQEHYDEELTGEFLAAYVHLSPTYFCELFKKHTGQTWLNYLTALRMEKADEYLRAGGLKVCEAARRVGYENARYFSRVYKRYYGKPPAGRKR